MEVSGALSRMKPTFFARRALLLLMVVFFLVPFAVRGARNAVQRMKNDVKDWLPSSFHETKDMDWFWQHFMGERFILVSWDGCTGTADDDRYQMLLQKLAVELPPSQVAVETNGAQQQDVVEVDSVAPADTAVTAAEVGGADGLYVRLERPAGFIGDRLGLQTSGEFYENWGQRQEKWIQGNGDQWYFITPDGELYRWDASDAPVVALGRLLWRTFVSKEVKGEPVASFGPEDGPWYYENPRRLNAQFFKTATSGPIVLEHLTKEGGVLHGDPEEALSRLTGSLFGPDGKQTCLMLTMTEAGKQDFHRVLGRGMMGRPRGRLLDLAEESGIPPAQLRLGGPPVDNIAIDEEGTVTLVRLVGLCAALGLGIAYICLRSIPLTFMVFFVGGISAVLAMSLIWWMGSSVDAIMMSMPALVYVLGLSSAIHIINYYRDAVREHGLQGAPERAIAHGWVPCTLCAVTTALGMLSLYTSEIEPIRKFGLFAAIGVVATLAVLFAYLPSALQIWPPRQPSSSSGPHASHSIEPHWSTRFWEWYAGKIVRYNGWVAAGCVLLAVVLAVGITRIKTSVQILKMFDSESKIIEDYAWLETHLGKLVPMEIVVKVSPEMMLPTAEERAAKSAAKSTETGQEQIQLSFLERMEIVDRVQRVINEEFGPQGQDIAGQTISAVTWAPELPQAKGDTLTFARRGGTNGRLEAHRNEFLKSDYLRIDKQDQSELWRISVRLGALQDVDYGLFVTQLKEAVEPVMAAYQQREIILREIILRGIGQQDGGKRSAGAKVLVLGREVVPVAASAEGKGPVATNVDQTKIFARTLHDLLNVARLKVNWFDPHAQPLPANWEQSLAAFDCVVVVDDFPGCDMETIKARAKLAVDARAHYFDPIKDDEIATPQATQVSAVYTGVVPLVYKAQRTLLQNLMESTFWSFVLVGGCMTILLTPGRSLLGRLRPDNLGVGLCAGLVSMVPNIFPVLVIFGAMGWAGIEVDIGSMMTASVALGIAVDDTIHFLTWFRWGLNQGMHRHQAIVEAYRRCASAMCQTTLIGGLGMFIFATSTFTPTQRFGVLMLTLLVAALVGDLVLGPALYAGPLGFLFKPSAKDKPDASLDLAPTELALRERIESPHDSVVSDPHTTLRTRHKDTVAP
jgi:predicted RND superfamily exporter protein